MNFQLQLLQHLRSKREQNSGFTLIELLVVVIIVGVLAAIALPNLIGQVGKARESEAKTLVGAVNKGQQAFHTETGFFYDTARATAAAATNPLTWQNALGVTNTPEYYVYTNVTVPSTAPRVDAIAQMTADGVDPSGNGTRDFATEIGFTNATGTYANLICVAEDKQDSSLAANLPAGWPIVAPGPTDYVLNAGTAPASVNAIITPGAGFVGTTVGSVATAPALSCDPGSNRIE